MYCKLCDYKLQRNSFTMCSIKSCTRDCAPFKYSVLSEHRGASCLEQLSEECKRYNLFLFVTICSQAAFRNYWKTLNSILRTDKAKL